MTAPERMHRLLMGDVGTGKTVVALFAMLLAVENDFQAALMAPTELLAEQHAATLTRLLAPLDLRPELLLGRLTAAREGGRRGAGSPAGSRGSWSGTHALMQESVTFQRLGLVVIDEQHRFGVEQRAALIGKGAAPDVLLLTATPIPRSLALTLLRRPRRLDAAGAAAGPGRGPDRGARRAASASGCCDFVRDRVPRGRQAYVVLPVIEESERTDLRAATTMAQTLAARWPELAVGLVHGRLKAEERDDVMRRFRGRRDPGPGGDDGDRSRHRRAQRHHHGDRAPGAVRPGAAAPAPRPGRARGGGELLHPAGRRARRADRLQAFAATQDGFKIAELDLEERGWAT